MFYYQLEIPKTYFFKWRNISSYCIHGDTWISSCTFTILCEPAWKLIKPFRGGARSTPYYMAIVIRWHRWINFVYILIIDSSIVIQTLFFLCAMLCAILWNRLAPATTRELPYSFPICFTYVIMTDFIYKVTLK